MSNQAKDWSERKLLETFVGDLNLDIQDEVKAFQPCSMMAAISFATFRERKINAENYGATKIVNGLLITKSLIPVFPNITQEHHSKEGQPIRVESIASEQRLLILMKKTLINF